MSGQQSTDQGGVHPGVSPWRVWLPVLAFLAVLDLTFPRWFWSIPKITSPDADWGYQFAIDHQQAIAAKPSGTTRVLAFGSSVSGSFDPQQIESLLRAEQPEEPIAVDRLMLPGTHPSEYLMLFESRALQAPDVAVLLVNLVDFLDSDEGSTMNPTLRAVLSPFKLWRARADEMSVGDLLDVAFSSVSNLYRYRKLIRSAVQDHAKLIPRWLRSASPNLPYGVYPDGFTMRRFAVVPPNGSLEYFVDPEWIRQRGRIRLRFAAAGRRLAERFETEPGWKSVAFEGLAEDTVVHAAADSVWIPRAGGHSDDLRPIAVRLRNVPPTSRVGAQRQPFRYDLSEEGDLSTLLRMQGKRGTEFEAAWNETLERKNRFGSRFRGLRDAKLAVRERPFEESAEFHAVRSLVRFFRERSSRILIINTPESPFLLRDYQESEYYRGYRSFFRSLARGPGVDFLDLSDAMPAEDFNDWHHLNYIGIAAIGPRYASAVQASLNARPMPR